jgi:DNA polymerase-3 subunit gamma/tau
MSEDIEKKVLALKYRPHRFEDLVGQSTVSQTLSLALDSNRLSHAYLFSGLRGSGKTSTARIMAKAFLCSQGPTSKPCEVCENCQSANNSRHLDIIEMDAASNRGIDDIKDLIEHTKYKPSSARFKVFIIDEVHMLTTQAFNALLKTLEEPPGFVKFILATTDPLKLPATILSRTQHFRFKKIANKDVLHHLTHILNEENIEFETEALEIITRSGQGSLRDTLTLLDQAIIFSKGKVTTTAVVDMLGLIDPAFMEEIFDTVLSNSDTTAIIRRLEEYEAGQVCDEMGIYLKQKMLERDPKFDVMIFDRFFRIIADAKHLLALNSDSSFVLILMLLKMSEATSLKTIDEVINEIESMEVKEANKVCDASLSHAIKPQVVVEHSHEENTQIVAPEVQEAYHTTLESTPNPKQEVAQESKVEESVTQSQPEIIQPQSAPENIVNEESSSSQNVQSMDEQESVIVSNTPSLNQETVLVNESDVNSGVSNPFEIPLAQEPVVAEETAPIQEEKPASNAFEQEPIQPKNLESVMQDVGASMLEQTPIMSEEEQAKDEIISAPAVEEVASDNEPNPLKDKFELVINRVYDRDIELGEAFEENFFFKNFENNELQIDSFAHGDTRKFLLKHYGIIKTFFYDVYGNDIELKFFTQEPKVPQQEAPNFPQPASNESANNNEAGSMIEDIEMGSGCVADMHKTAQPTPSQQELQMQDILNSPMLNKAKELFDIKKITVKTKT